MIDETFAAGDSVLHRLDPRLKVIFTFFFSFFIALSKVFPVLYGALGCSLLLIVLAQLPFRLVVRRLYVVNMFNAILWLILPLTFEGETFYSLWGLHLTEPGLLLSLEITLKSNTILLAFIALIATSYLSSIGHALEIVQVPVKIVHLLMISYRYVFVLEQEYHRLANAAKIRSFSPKTNLHTYRTYAYMFGMLLVRASDRADRVYQAMLCRGFHGKLYCLHEFCFRRQDLIAAAIMTLVLLALGWLQWTGNGGI